jgi:acetyl-CoA carboxylase biotin carboxyl carrier protein
MDLSELERLVEMVKNAEVGELTLRQGNARLTLRKAAPTERMSSALVPFHGSHLDDFDDDDTEAVGVPDLRMVEGDAEKMVFAPLVGIFHHVKPVVGLGAKVREGQKIGLIEAMKLVNDVTAPADGTITDVFIEDGLPVEYGQTLFALRTENG